MKLILVGDPEYEFTVQDYVELEQLYVRQPLSELRVGGHNAFAECVRIWARLVRLPLRYFNADWVTCGPGGAVIRPHPILDGADAVALFSRGLPAGLAEACLQRGLFTHDFRIA